MHTRRHRGGGRCLGYLLLLFVLGGCSAAAYRFQYHYTMVSPSGGSEALEDDRLRLELTPDPEAGVLHLSLHNKTVQPLEIVWRETHYLNPLGRRRSVSESGMRWFRPSQWLADDTRIAPGDTFRTKVHPGSPQTYNPLTISRQATGNVTVSTSPPPLFPTSGDTPTLGQRYQGQEFGFVLTVRQGQTVVRYPFRFRITDVEVRPGRAADGAD